jgi:hypothetical protein
MSVLGRASAGHWQQKQIGGPLGRPEFTTPPAACEYGTYMVPLPRYAIFRVLRWASYWPRLVGGMACGGYRF